MGSKKKIVSLFIVLFGLLFAPLFSGPAIAADNPIATLTEFSGTVLIRSQGSWEVEPREGLPLYSDDKVVTRIGVAVIQFEDGAVLEIKSNSNLNIQEKEEKKGIFRRGVEKSRSIRLMVGKILFRTGPSPCVLCFSGILSMTRGVSHRMPITAENDS